MFRRNKNENRAKLEHKLYLARENPEPVFDISECNLFTVPSGIYSLCKVFLKVSLHLQHNSLTSLSGGGVLKDLSLLKILDISYNHFSALPDEIYLLQSLQELNTSNNKIKKLPWTVGRMTNLKSLNVSNNSLKCLPDSLGDLINLRQFDVCGNKHLQYLPKTICKIQRLILINLDAINFIYPPSDIAEKGTESIMKFICDNNDVSYVSPETTEDITLPKEKDEFLENDHFQAKIWELEKIKQQKMLEFLEIEKHNELLQRQELEMANSQKINREKLLETIAQEQNKFDLELNKIHKLKEFERFRLIEQLQEAENSADLSIKQLLSLNKEPLIQLLEQEEQEKEKLLTAIDRYNETLRKDDILTAMETILQQETEHFLEYHQNRVETSKSILEQEVVTDSKLSEIFKSNDLHKAELLFKLQEDGDLQKAAVGTLLERGDARSWGLLQQVRLVEAQLAALTSIEMDRRKLEIDHHLNDLSEKRVNLSMLLLDLLEQQKQRRLELIQTLEILEENNDSIEDFWLKQYQRLLDKLPSGLSEAQKNIDPALGQALIINGVIHCLPFLAKFTQCQFDTNDITDDDLKVAGVTNCVDRIRILEAFRVFKKEKDYDLYDVSPSAPSLPVEEASAPLPEQINTICTSECVICLDLECEIIFFPCGHLCCCLQCSTAITECPMCRSDINRKIKIIAA